MGFSYAISPRSNDTLYAMAGEFIVQFGSGVPVAATTRFGNVVGRSALFIRFLLSMAFISIGDEPIALTETDPIASRFALALR